MIFWVYNDYVFDCFCCCCLFLFARGLDEKKYCTYSITLVNKKKMFVHPFVLCCFQLHCPEYIHNKINHFICSEVLCHHLGAEVWHTLKNLHFFRLNPCLELQNTMKTAPFKASFYITSNITDHVTWIPQVSQNVAETGLSCIHATLRGQEWKA